MAEKTIEQRVDFIERVFWVAGAVAVVFGVSGAWGLSVLTEAKNELNALRMQVEAEGQNLQQVREDIVPVQEFVDRSETLVDVARSEIDKATNLALASIDPKVNAAIDRLIAERSPVTAIVTATRNIKKLGQHNALTLRARKGDLIFVSYSGSARSGEFYYKIVSPDNSAEPLVPDSRATKVVQLTQDPWRSISANQIFRAKGDGEVRLAIEYFKSDVTGVVKVYGSTLSAHLLQ